MGEGANIMAPEPIFMTINTPPPLKKYEIYRSENSR
jgi:hypothetical protein